MEKRRMEDDKPLFLRLVPEAVKIVFAAGLVYGAMAASRSTLQSEAARYRDIVDINSKRITILEANSYNLEKSFDMMRTENKEAHAMIMRYLERR